MKIFFDHQIFSLQRYGGVSKYFVEIMKRIPKDEWVTSTVFSNNAYIQESGLFAVQPFLSEFTFYGKERLLSLTGNIYSSYKILTEKFDVFHQTDYNPYCIPFLNKRNIPMVTTCHDLNFATINKCGYLMRWQKESMENADAIISISNYTKNELIRLWNISPDKIFVVHHGINQPGNLQYNRIFDFPYILYVGTRFDFKNFNSVLKTAKNLFYKYKDLRLVCTGNRFQKDEIKIMANLGIQNRVVHISASEKQLYSLYHFAELFVFPSYSEGFGMPLLEAMVNMCPVACSNTSCFPEIAEDAALYFSPNSLDEMYDVLDLLLSNSSVREQYVTKGIQRVRNFSWDSSVNAHLKIYRKLI